MTLFSFLISTTSMLLLSLRVEHRPCLYILFGNYRQPSLYKVFCSFLHASFSVTYVMADTVIPIDNCLTEYCLKKKNRPEYPFKVFCFLYLLLPRSLHLGLFTNNSPKHRNIKMIEKS